MNKKAILYIIGWVLIIEGAAMQLPTIVGLIYGESQFRYFIYVGLSMALLGALIIFKRPKNLTMYKKEGFASTAISWLVLSLCGAIPLCISGTIPSYLDAFFETASGFTTTGSTILTEIEGLPYCMLFWRSFTHWLGGMGVIVFLLAIIPNLGGNQSINLMKAESTGPSVEKGFPKLRNYAFSLYAIYSGLTVLEIILLLLGGMNLYDSITTSFSCAGTGGFMVYNDSLASFSPYIQTVAATFMLLFGVNFAVYILILTRKFRQAFKNSELWVYLGIIVAITVLIAVDIKAQYQNFFEGLRHSYFYVCSIISTTGSAIEDNNNWPVFSQALIMLIMCVGACAGSTGGGMKVSRIMILFKEIKKELHLLVHPRTVQTIKVDGKKVSNEVVRSVAVYLIIYVFIIVFSTIILTLDKFDFYTAFSGTLATLNNVGPGFSHVGSMNNFADFSFISKLMCIFNMLAGRLELYPIILLLTPAAWRRN